MSQISEPERSGGVGAVGASSCSDLVTVVIPARNEERTIGEAVASVAGQTYSNLQILVVDGGSTDRTRKIVEALRVDDPRIELLGNPDRAIPFALNIALAAARGRWMVRVDAHSAIPSNYVETIVHRFRSGDWGGVGGRKDAVGHTAQGRAIAAVMGSKFAQGNSIYHYGTTAQTVDHIPFGAYPVELARSLGGWSETQLVNEDFEFDYRLRQSGHELLFDPEIRIDWDCRQRVSDLFSQYRRYGAGKVQTLVTHPESLSARNLAAPVLVAGLAGSVVLLTGKRSRKLGLHGLLPYGAVLAAGTMDTIANVERGERRWIVPAFMAIHLGWGTGVWLAVVRRWLGRSEGRGMEASSGSTR
ncbi:MAG: glycosyltransferase family 2 protein [Microthrixaceae bacterium]